MTEQPAEQVTGATGAEPSSPADPSVQRDPAQPATDASAMDELAVAQPATDAPAMDEPAVDQPADPPTDQPATDQPTEQPPEQPAQARASTEQPTPRPRPVPRPRPTPHPPAPSVPHPPVQPPVDAEDAAAAAAWGRVDADGTVWVREAGGERSVGQYPGADTEEALAFYVRRFLDLQAQVVLFETRLPQLSVKEIDQTLKSLTGALEEPTAVGDIDGLRARLEVLRSRAQERREAAAAERTAAREQAVAARTAIVTEAEQIAEQDAGRTQWKQSGERLRELLDQWKTAQRSGPRLDRPTEDRLWKRFSHARTAFDRHRRQFFAELDAVQAEAKAAKERLIARAEALSTSTDWRGTSIAYRELMDEWKAAGRAARREDDALWARFRAAQQSFFDARNAENAQTDAEYAENLTAKLEVLEKAEALLPVTDVAAAKAGLRPLQDRWEDIGKVPRADVQRVEGRMRAVEQAVRDAEQAVWRRSNPETKARAEGAAAQLEAAIASLERDRAAAAERGDARAAEDAQRALDARRAWLDQVQRAADDAG